MRAERLKLKLFAAEPEALAPAALVPVFHSWIRENKLNDELLIDVADYGHVHHGPGVVLIGHAADYYWDLGEGRPGLMFSRKRDAPPEEQRLADAFRRALAAARLLELAPGVRFETDQLRLEVPDRLNAPNTDATLDAWRGDLLAFLAPLYPDGVEVEREGGEREPLTVRVRAKCRPTTAELLSRLQAAG